MDTPTPPRRRFRWKTIVLSILALFLLPIAARAALYAYEGGSGSWRTADWSSTGSLPAAQAEPEARVLIMSGLTGGWKGVFSVHSWVVFKPQNGKEWRRYDVVGWGDPVRANFRDPDGRWYGNMPQVVLDLRGEAATKAIPKIEAAVKEYKYASAGDYRIWPGPNSNTFVATVLARHSRSRSGPAGERGRPRLPALSLCRPDRQRHRRRSEPVGHRRRQARLGRGRGNEFPRPRRRARPAQSRHQAAGLRPHRLAAANGDRRPAR